MSNECSHFTASHSEADTAVDNVGEIRNAILKVIANNLHHASALLNDGNFWREEHFRSAVDETVRWLGTSQR